MRSIPLLIFILFFGCYTIERNCQDVKTGTFEFSYTIDGQEKIGRFERTSTLNIDYFEGKIDSASIRWINDCEFIQTKINPKNMSEEKAIHMKILSTTDSSYTFEYNFVGDSFKQKGLAKKIL